MKIASDEDGLLTRIYTIECVYSRNCNYPAQIVLNSIHIQKAFRNCLENEKQMEEVM